MKNETHTKEKLLKAAKEEFMEKGFTAASLRSICKKAEVTTGALYFFFNDKEDLFGSLVEEPLHKLYQIMQEHYNVEMEQVKNETIELNMQEDIEASKLIVKYLFYYHDEFVLLLDKSKDSKYEKCVDDFIEISEKHYRIMADMMSEVYQLPRVDDSIIHWFAHVQVSSFVYLITHGLTEEEANKQIEMMLRMMVSGWFGIWGSPLEAENKIIY